VRREEREDEGCLYSLETDTKLADSASLVLLPFQGHGAPCLVLLFASSFGPCHGQANVVACKLLH
jgi:hypothetical protein